MPRDVEPEVGDLAGVTLFDVGALRDRGSAEEDEAVERARGIVAEEVRRFVVRRRGDELSPVIRAIRRRGDAVLESELARHASRLADLTPTRSRRSKPSRAGSSRSSSTTRSWR